MGALSIKAKQAELFARVGYVVEDLRNLAKLSERHYHHKRDVNDYRLLLKDLSRKAGQDDWQGAQDLTRQLKSAAWKAAQSSLLGLASHSDSEGAFQTQKRIAIIANYRIRKAYRISNYINSKLPKK